MAPHSPPLTSPRRPLPQPVEESSRSNHKSRHHGGATSSTSASTSTSSKTTLGSGTSVQPARRPLPRPVEISSSTTSTKKKAAVRTTTQEEELSRNSTESMSKAGHSLPDSSTTSTGAPSPRPRKFAPQMIETSRRSRRNTRSDTSDTDTTPSASPGPKHSATTSADLETTRPLKSWQTSEPKPPDDIPHAPESRFSSSKLAEKAPRRHSFRVPDLPDIPSTTDSNDSSSSSADADDRSGPDRWRRRKGANKRGSQARESQDESTSGYLLSLAARAAEKQLKEQVMAAYPNEHLHEPVDHYAGDRDSDEESEVETGVGQLSMGKHRSADDDGEDDDDDEEDDEDDGARRSAGRQQRDSVSGEGGWGLAELRKHRDKLEQQKREAWEAESSEQIAMSNIGADDPNAEFHRRGANAAGKAPTADTSPKPWQTHNELKSMAKAASPPMAGQNLYFPRCQSPRNTRLDVHQYPGQLKPHGKDDSQEHSGLWTAKGGDTSQASQPGLWMGVNATSAQEKPTSPVFMRSGVMTPAVEQGDPLSPNSSIAPSRNNSYVPASSLPPSPPSSQEEVGGSQKAAKRPRVATTASSKQLDSELDDTFVTQVYNYLSLGYPSLARPYDEELAKIAQMDIATLRRDDRSGNSKGYIGAPEGTGLDVRGCRAGACQRWLALQKYIKEWGRQQSLARGAGGPGWDRSELANDQGGWGARARRGSWAI